MLTGLPAGPLRRWPKTALRTALTLR